MDARALQRIRRKVDHGERLTAPELSHLRAAAETDGSVESRLAVALALADAEASPESLALLESLRRERPGDPLVERGYARALVAADRVSEAEGVLERALADRPEDPELLKSLAVLAVRQGRSARAHEHVRALRVAAPEDLEARVLEEALDAAHQDGRKALRPEFVSALLRALESRQVRHLRHGKELWVRLAEGGLGKVDLGALHTAYLAEGSDLSRSVDAIAEELSEAAGAPPDRGTLLATVTPALRAQAPSDTAHREGPAGLVVVYLVDGVRPLSDAALRASGLDVADVDASAWKNLDQKTTPPRPVIVDRGHPRLAPESLGLWALCEADGLDSARLLSAAEHALLRKSVGPEPWRVSLARPEMVLVCRTDDATACAMLESLAPADDGIGGHWLARDGRLDAWPTS